MNKGRLLVLVGSLVLIFGAFLPWISVPNLYGLHGPAYEGIEAGWEGDGFLTGGAGVGLMLFEGLWGRKPRRWYPLAGIVLAALAALVVLLDFGQILEIDPQAGFFAAADIGLYVTLAGALLAGIGWLERVVPAPRQREALSSG